MISATLLWAFVLLYPSGPPVFVMSPAADVCEVRRAQMAELATKSPDVFSVSGRCVLLQVSRPEYN